MNKKFCICFIFFMISGVFISSPADPLVNTPQMGLAIKPPGVNIPAVPDNPGLPIPSPGSQRNQSSQSVVTPGNLTNSLQTNQTSSNSFNQQSQNKTAENQTILQAGRQEYVPDRVIVRYRIDQVASTGNISTISADANNAIGAIKLADESTLGVSGMQVVRLPGGVTVNDAISQYEKNPSVEYAQPDYIYHALPMQDLKVPVVINQEVISYRDRLSQGTHVPVVSGPENNGQPIAMNSTVNPVTRTNESVEYGYMHLTQEEVEQIQSEYLAAPKVDNAALNSPSGNKSLLSDIQYTPSERNQGNCGNCWVWASTGVVEVAHTIQTGVKDRLSIQYFDSNYNGGSASSGACNGGWGSTFANFYSTAGYKQMIPWSNTNAYYNDTNACSYGCGARTPAASISTTPNYPVTSMSTMALRTYSVSQAQAIANIKAQIDSNKAVWWGYYLPNSSSWKAFSSYWSGQTESALWNPDPHNNFTYGSSGGGHAVIIVGYDDTSSDPNQRYWLVLNSWGTTSGRQNGLFRLKMNMDYRGHSSNGYQNHYFYIFNVGFGGSVQTGSVTVSSSPSGARIWLDGVDTGKNTPDTLTSVAAGSHTIILKLIGYNDYSTSTIVTPGQTTSVAGTLTPSLTGNIYITSNPAGATIFLNSLEQGGTQTPATLVSIPTGTHSVLLTKPGYQDWSSGVTVRTGQTTTLSATMTPSSSPGQVIPNDPYFSYEWGLHNTGQTGGTVDADIDAPEAWTITKGSSNVIVGVVDTGVDYTHADLTGNILRNSNGVVTGYDFVNNDADPMDDNGHGTHVSGTIAATGNNGIGVTGVTWNSKIMPLKFLDSSGSGYTSDAISAFAWGYAHGARIFSNSWGGSGVDSALQDAINTYPDALFVCAAGNSAQNTDISPQSPSALPDVNILAVAATDANDNLASFSNYGPTTVDVAAPGVSIVSTYPVTKGSYAWLSGTSMATPHVTGIAALVKAVAPSSTVAQIKQTIMNGVDVKSGLSRKCVTGGRVNAYKSIQGYGSPPPTVSSITPASAKTGSVVSITNLAGTNFVSGARVNLTRSGYLNVTATGISVVSSSQITGSLNLGSVAPGSWNVVVINPDGKLGVLNGGFTVLPNITASFYGVPGTQVFPNTIQFYDASTGNPVSWAWNFGDGNTSATRNPLHIYSRTGTFTVNLTISDGFGSSSSLDKVVK